MAFLSTWVKKHSQWMCDLIQIASGKEWWDCGWGNIIRNDPKLKWREPSWGDLIWSDPKLQWWEQQERIDSLLLWWSLGSNTHQSDFSMSPNSERWSQIQKWEDESWVRVVTPPRQNVCLESWAIISREEVSQHPLRTKMTLPLVTVSHF